MTATSHVTFCQEGRTPDSRVKFKGGIFYDGFLVTSLKESGNGIAFKNAINSSLVIDVEDMKTCLTLMDFESYL